MTDQRHLFVQRARELSAGEEASLEKIAALRGELGRLRAVAEYARCLDGCARVLALRHARVEHGPDYCTCGYQAAWKAATDAE